MAAEEKKTLYDQILGKFKNNKWVVIILISIGIIVGFSKCLDSTVKIKENIEKLTESEDTETQKEKEDEPSQKEDSKDEGNESEEPTKPIEEPRSDPIPPVNTQGKKIKPRSFDKPKSTNPNTNESKTGESKSTENSSAPTKDSKPTYSFILVLNAEASEGEIRINGELPKIIAGRGTIMPEIEVSEIDKVYTISIRNIRKPCNKEFHFSVNKEKIYPCL